MPQRKDLQRQKRLIVTTRPPKDRQPAVKPACCDIPWRQLERCIHNLAPRARKEGVQVALPFFLSATDSTRKWRSV